MADEIQNRTKTSQNIWQLLIKMYLNRPYDCHPAPENIFKKYGNACSHTSFYVNAFSGFVHKRPKLQRS